MSRSMNDLAVEFAGPAQTLLDRCADRGFIMRPFFTLRDVWEQARLWRQSRSTAQIQAAIHSLEVNHAPFLAEVLHSVGPQQGRWATNALPGQSWHNWALAMDCFNMTAEGGANWDDDPTMTNEPYDIYAAEAVKLGLTAGHFWTRRDSVHVQMPVEHKPNMLWRDIDAEMHQRFAERETYRTRAA